MIVPRLLNTLLLLCWSALAFVLSVSAVLITCDNDDLVSEEEATAPFCGNMKSINSDTLYTQFLAGKQFFKANCAQCHNKNMIDDLTGPALSGVRKRWAAYPKEDLYRWIRNSQALIAEGHPRALKIYREWNNNAMIPFPDLSDEEIENILVYIENVN